MHPLAVCPTCRFVFAAVDLDFAGSIVGLKDIGVMCPRCRSMAFVPDGLYDFREAVEQIARSLAGQPDNLKKARKLAEAAAFGTISPVAAVGGANKISFKLGKLFKKAYGFSREAFGFGVGLATLYCGLLAYEAQKSSEETQQQMDVFLERLIAIQERNQPQNAEDVPRPRARPLNFGAREADENQSRPLNRHESRKAGALARKRPK
jgi:hypothetical protein